MFKVPLTEISPRLRQVRSVLQKTQREFAASLGISLSHYSKLEAGIGGISDKVIYAVAAQAQISPEWLKTGQGQPPACQLMANAPAPQTDAYPSLECISEIVAVSECAEVRALAEKMVSLTGVSFSQALTDLVLASHEFRGELSPRQNQESEDVRER